MKPRKPNKTELGHLRKELIKEGLDDETAEYVLKYAAIAVFDDYKADYREYCGKIITIVYSNNPSWYEVFMYDTENKNIKKLKQDFS